MGNNEQFHGNCSVKKHLACSSTWYRRGFIATALGLVAAIPAVIAYNKLSTDISRFAGRLEAFAGEFGAILSRQAEDGD